MCADPIHNEKFRQERIKSSVVIFFLSLNFLFLYINVLAISSLMLLLALFMMGGSPFCFRVPTKTTQDYHSL